MGNIKILDCTLRDGGYINNWNFQEKNIKNFLNNLISSNIDFIECGFFKKEIKYNKDITLFNSILLLQNFFNNEILKQNKLTLMINYGDYSIDYIENAIDKNIMFRVAFKKSDLKSALMYCNQLKEKGYDIFINPMHTNFYTTEELLYLIKEVNKISPYAFSIVDTTGSMKEKNILSLFYLIDDNLNKNIALCFHSHNNLQLSFSNAQCLMKNCRNRELIIDSTVFGMGRGAGNLCTELLTQYINDNYNGHYNIIPILKIIDEQINPIFARTPWGYSVPYYLAATNHCHPNYAKYLVDKQTVTVEIINSILKSIPDDKKSTYDKDLIKQFYLDKVANSIDDKVAVQEIEKMLKNKKILILAPGKSLKTEKEKVEKYIKENNPFVISLNFEPEDYKSDLAFVSNIKRFSSLENLSTKLAVTSNIINYPESALVLNYSSYLNNSKMFDNVALILLKLLIKIGIKGVSFAGFDGFSNVITENYLSTDLINNARENDIDERNEIISNELENLSKKIKIDFITKSMYQ